MVPHPSTAMPSYYINEAVFTLPEKGFADRTLHRLELPLSGGAPLGIEVRRLPMDRGKSLRALVDAEIAATKTKVNGFTVLEDVEAAVGGAPAILLRARLRARDEAYYQRQAHVALGETWMALVATAPYAERATLDHAFDRIVQSFAWRRD